ncbi:hypothetical protein ACFOW1_02600 [Parasediminibacterium paludis]|uniref:Uncharacterized protein n=1 Tax=Parasediminibacterium paludis TaxID=908966 RepID=A0ABV8PSA7_9BACT
MLDTAIIREHYASMSDEHLIAFTINEGSQISNEAFEILRNEFIKRNLDTSPLENSDDTKKLIHEQKIQKVKESGSEEYLSSIWDYALNEKEENKTDLEIIKGLKERGLEDENAQFIILGLENRAKSILKHHESQTAVGGFICVAGIIITFWTLANASENGGSYFITWGAIVFGAIRFFTNISAQSKYKTIVANIEAIKPAEQTMIS